MLIPKFIIVRDKRIEKQTPAHRVIKLIYLLQLLLKKGYVRTQDMMGGPGAIHRQSVLADSSSTVTTIP